MSNSTSIYLISNASSNTYEYNTLSDFVNKLPNSIELEKDENVVVSVESIGMSCNFRNIFYPRENCPSIVVTNCGHQENNEYPFDDIRLEDIDDLNTFKNVVESYKFPVLSEETRDRCSLVEYYMVDKFHEKKDVEHFCHRINENLNLKFEYTDRMIISRNVNRDYWLLMHPTFYYTFDMDVDFFRWSKELRKKVTRRPFRKSYLQSLYRRDFVYKGEVYFGFRFTKDTIGLAGAPHTLKGPLIPEIVKVQSSIISSQIFNNHHEKDLLILCPDFHKNNDQYYFKEFEQPQKIKLENTSISNIDIFLRDQNNNKLQLLPGIATVICLKLEKMPTNHKSFNVRVTSKANSEYPKNKKNNFKVQMPHILDFNTNKNWKVALTSISHPNNYNTFPPLSKNEKAIVFIPADTRYPKIEHYFNSGIYKEDDLINELNDNFLQYFGVKFTKENKNMKFELPGRYLITNSLLKILGCSKIVGVVDPSCLKMGNNGWPVMNLDKKFTTSTLTDDQHFWFEFEQPININYFQPEYIVVYTNIVKETIIGGSNANILRIVPIPKTETDDYIVQEFKNKNFIALSNTEVSEIEINLRGHDGTLIDFNGAEDNILNLEFSNSE